MVLRNRWDLSLQILIEPCRGDHCVKSNIVNNLCKDMVYTFVLQCNLINPKFKARSLTQKSFLYCVKAKIKIPPRRLYAASGGAGFLMQHLHRRGDVTLASPSPRIARIIDIFWFCGRFVNRPYDNPYSSTHP